MQSNIDIAQKTIRLLSTLDLDKVAAIAAELVIEITGSASVAVLMWDEDLERIGDRFIFGVKQKEFSQFVELFGEKFDKDGISTAFLGPKSLDIHCEQPRAPAKSRLQEGIPPNMLRAYGMILEIDSDGISANLEPELQPVLCYPVGIDNDLCAMLLMAGCATNDWKHLKESLNMFPFAKVLAHAWCYRELERENKRLRGYCEEAEDKTSRMEEKTVKLIRDVAARESIRAKQVERERLVYWISNAVRSSVRLREVLETTVEKIGTTLGVSRCLLLRLLDGLAELEVFEFDREPIPPVKELFFASDGLAFAQTALTRTSPHDLHDPESDNQSTYDPVFLRKLGIRSGLMVPLVMRDRVLGVLFLQDCTDERQWTIDDVSLIGSLADNLAVAIENAELHQERERQAVTDGLTGVGNRRNFNDSLKRECERAQRYNEPLSLILIDLDFLKKINDTYGHQAGDEAIKAIGKVLKQSSRSIDLPARYGGEEFCLILPNTDIEMAHQIAERLKRLISDIEIEGPGKITASLGVASLPLHADNPVLLFQRADQALYEAKKDGRNQVKIAVSLDKPNERPDVSKSQISGNRLSQQT